MMYLIMILLEIFLNSYWFLISLNVSMYSIFLSKYLAFNYFVILICLFIFYIWYIYFELNFRKLDIRRDIKNRCMKIKF